MPHKLSDHTAHILGEFLACYYITLRLLEELMPLIKRYSYRAYKRKHKRRKAKQRKGQSEL